MPARSAGSSARSISCSLGLPSCRRFMALQERVTSRRILASQGGKKRQKTAARY
jgi:hypothetical protein